MIRHIRRWNIWRKHCLNCGFYKFLVLIGAVVSPTLELTLLPDEQENIDRVIRNYTNNDIKVTNELYNKNKRR